MRWLGRFSWDAGSETFDLTLPPRLWTESLGTIGGFGRSGGGVGSGYVVREDYRIALPLRIYQSEWPRFLDLLAWARSGAAFTWTPDVENAPLETFSVSLESPAAGEDVAADPDATYPQVKNVTIVLRNGTQAPFNLDYFAEP